MLSPHFLPLLFPVLAGTDNLIHRNWGRSLSHLSRGQEDKVKKAARPLCCCILRRTPQ